MNQPFPFSSDLVATASLWGFILAILPVIVIVWLGWRPAYWFLYCVLGKLKKTLGHKTPYIGIDFKDTTNSPYREYFGVFPQIYLGEVFEISKRQIFLDPVSAFYRKRMAKKKIPLDSYFQKKLGYSSFRGSGQDFGIIITRPMFWGSAKAEFFWAIEDQGAGVKVRSRKASLNKSGLEIPFAAELKLIYGKL